jgi:hypothetical protein
VLCYTAIQNMQRRVSRRARRFGLGRQRGRDDFPRARHAAATRNDPSGRPSDR